MILALVAAGKTVGVTANSHKVIGNVLDAVVAAAKETGARTATGGRIVIGQKPARRRGPRRAPMPSRSGDARDDRGRARGRDAPRRRGHGLALVRRPPWRGASTSSSSTRPASSASPTPWPSRPPAARSCCSATPSSSTSPSRGATRPAPSGAPSPISSPAPRASRRTPPCRPSAASSSSGPGASIPRSAPTRASSSTRPSCARSTASSARRSRPRPRRAGRRCPPVPIRRPRRRQRHPLAARRARRQRHDVDRGGRGDRRGRPRPARRGRPLDEPRRGRGAAAPRGHRDRGAVQRPRRPDRREPSRAPGFAGGARRHRRQVPGPGGAALDLRDGVVVAGGRPARHGVPLLPQPAERGHVAGPLRRARRGVARPRRASPARRPARCSSRTPSAGSSRWRRRAEVASLQPGECDQLDSST